MKLEQLSPMLESNDLPGTIDFYRNVLGFTLRGVFKDEKDPRWCDLAKDDVSIMFCMPNTHMNYGRIMLSGSLYIRVQDVNSHWLVLKDNCEIVYPIESFEYQMREFAIKEDISE